MINLKKASLLAAMSVLLLPAAVFAVERPQDVVRDKRNNVVTSTDGNCVVTKWTAKNDDCAAYKRGMHSILTKEQRTVYFDFNKSTLNAKEKKKLDEVSKIIHASKMVESVDIVGFADRIGKSTYNQRLSKKRAETVKAYLAAKGLKTHKVRVEGKGESDSVTNCSDKEDRKELIACLAEDRRVEIQLNLKSAK